MSERSFSHELDSASLGVADLDTLSAEPEPAKTRQCFHCGEAVDDDSVGSLVFEGKTRQFCCPGCFIIAETIIESGQGHFYRYRTAFSEKPDFTPNDLPAALKDSLALYDQPDNLEDYSHLEAEGTRSASLIIEGISCAACGWLIETQLSQLSGLHSVSLNLSTHRLWVEWQPEQLSFSQILQACYRIGFAAKPFNAESDSARKDQEAKTSLKRLVVAGIGAMQVMMFAIPLYVGAFKGIADEFQLWLRLAGALVASAVIFYSSMTFVKAAWRSLKAMHLTMDVPVSLAILLAYFASIWSTLTQGPEVYFDSICMFTFFLLLGRHLEMKARHNAGQLSQNLMALTPETAYRMTARGTIETVLAKSLAVGDRVLIKPGARVCADGHIIKGNSTVDESILTGESLPIAKGEGDLVIAGSLNTESPIEVVITHVGQHTQLSTIARLQERALAHKPRLTEVADQVAHYFVLVILIVAALVYGVWYLIQPESAFWIMLSVLVVTCPCALSLATPTALTVATQRLKEKGLLIIKGHTLETLASIKQVALDKTGTITQGNVQVQAIHWHLDHQEDEAVWLWLCQHLESTSEHPIAKAILNLPVMAVTDQDIRHLLSLDGCLSFNEQQADGHLTQIRNLPGYGIEAQTTLEQFRIGRLDFVEALVDKGCDRPDWIAGSQILLGSNRRGWIAGFELMDPLTEDAQSLIAQLKNRGMRLWVLTGDQQAKAKALCHPLGVDAVHGGLDPEQKLAQLKGMQSQGPVLMVGDGVNDAPVLSQADVSMAVQKASDYAKASADALLSQRQLQVIVDALDMAKVCKRVIKQNLVWALCYNMLALPLAVLGFIPPWAAAIGMSVSSLIVVFNAIRLKHAA